MVRVCMFTLSVILASLEFMSREIVLSVLIGLCTLDVCCLLEEAERGAFRIFDAPEPSKIKYS